MGIGPMTVLPFVEKAFLSKPLKVGLTFSKPKDSKVRCFLFLMVLLCVLQFFLCSEPFFLGKLFSMGIYKSHETTTSYIALESFSCGGSYKHFFCFLQDARWVCQRVVVYGQYRNCSVNGR